MLTKKILTLNAYDYFIRSSFYKYTGEDCTTIDYDKIIFKINNVEFNTKELLWTLKFAVKLYKDNISSDYIIKTKEYLDLNFDFNTYKLKEGPINTINSCPHTIVNTTHNNEIHQAVEFTIQPSLVKSNQVDNQILFSQMAEVNKLQLQKDQLESKKLKAEMVLKTLKLFLVFKENTLKYKVKYRLLINFLISYKNGQSVEEIANSFVEEIILDNGNMSFETVSLLDENGEESDIFAETPSLLLLSETILNQIENYILLYVKNVLEDKTSEEEEQ